MKVRMLGCSGGIGAGLRTTSILVDDDILIDTGTGVGELTLKELRAVRHVFMTHSHLDHSGGLPLLIDTIFEVLSDPLTVYGRSETVEALKNHIFNWVLWPDFSVLPNAAKPCMRYDVMALGSTRTVGARTVRIVEVNHTVPGAGYIIESGGKVFAFSGDTAANDAFWTALNALPRVDVLVVETAFANANEELAWLSRHYCPKTLAIDLAKLKHDPQIWITHLKPGAEDAIFHEIEQAIPGRRLHRLRGGELFDL
jgi:ribonuclease BN (tRNA processing enzyme)